MWVTIQRPSGVGPAYVLVPEGILLFQILDSGYWHYYLNRNDYWISNTVSLSDAKAIVELKLKEVFSPGKRSENSEYY